VLEPTNIDDNLNDRFLSSHELKRAFPDVQLTEVGIGDIILL
jgi:hypothetical protein